MKSKLFFLTIFSVLCLFGNAETYKVEIGPFEKLKINGDINVIYKCLPDSTGRAWYEAPSGNDNIFNFTLKNDGSLKVEPSDEKWGKSDIPILHVYSDFLTSVESYSNERVEAYGIAPCASFNVNQIGNGSIIIDGLKCNNVSASISTGNGSIYLTGSCINANLQMIGAGLISADQLSAENVKCRILGTGTIGCWPIDNLKVFGIGSTKIYYKGKPNIKKTGGGKLFELPEEDKIPKRGVEVKTFADPDETVVTSDD